MAYFSKVAVYLLANSFTLVVGETLDRPPPKTFAEIEILGTALAGTGQDTNNSGSYFDSHTLSLCNNAPNCEIYQDPIIGKAIRFVKENVLEKNNGTAIVGRAAGDTAKFTAGTNVINWGNVQPQVVMNHLYDRCQESACSPQEIWYGTSAVRKLAWSDHATALASYSLITVANGDWYEGWDMRNNFVEAIKKMSEKGQQWTNQPWAWGLWTGGAYASDPDRLQVMSWFLVDIFCRTNCRSSWEIRQSDFYAISAWSRQGYIRGNMNVYIRADWGEKADWGCDRARDLVKDMISAVNGWAGAFFGLITPSY